MKANPTLTHKLEQYSTTARGQTSRVKSATEWAGYAAAAGASLAMAGTADAAIIYSGVQNVTAQIDPTAQATTLNSFYKFDSVTFTVGGSQFYATVGFTGGSLVSTRAKYAGGAFVQGLSGAGFIGTTAGPFGGAFSASFLTASQADIGPDGNFAAYGAGRFRLNPIGGSGSGTFPTHFTVGNFPLGATGIAGVQLASGNYGWIRLKLEDLGLNQPFANLLGTPLGDGKNFADKITVIDWAYEDSGAPIHAGDVPEPSALALLAAGAAGIGAFRRRKAGRTAH